MRQLKITKQVTNRETASLDKYLQEIGKVDLITADEEVELAQKINARATATEIKQYANKKGMVTMLEDGILKAKMGTTTIEEVLRATRD